MTTSTPPYRIVLALDLTQYAEVVLEHGLAQAALHPNPEIHVVTVVASDRDADDAKARLANLVRAPLGDLAADRVHWRARLHVRCGKAVEELPALAAEIRAHLLVIGRFGTHHPHRAIGKTAGDIIDRAPCPTLVVALTDQSPDAVTQCPDCVRVRAATDGEQWFCDAHRASDRHLVSPLVDAATTPWPGGGLMW